MVGLRPPSNSFILSFRLTRPAASLPAAVQNTTPEDVLSQCWCSLTLAHTTSVGIWHSAGATKSWLHSDTLKKSFAEILKCLNKKLEPSRLKANHSEITVEHELKRRNKCTRNQRKDLARVPVHVCLWNLSLFFGFPLVSNVDHGRCWCVVQNWSIIPQNGNLLEEWSSWIEESMSPRKMTWFAFLWWSFAQTLGYFVCWSGHLGLSSSVQDTTPKGVL